MFSLSPQAVKGMLANPNEPVSNLSYFHCIESVMENSKVGRAMTLSAAERASITTTSRQMETSRDGEMGGRAERDLPG